MMKIGIISDTHDRLQMIDEAVKRLNEENVEYVLHAGDYIAPFAVSRFKPLKAKLIGVFGNNDGDQNLIRRRFQELNGEIYGRFAELNINNLKIALIHGDDETLLKALINSNYFNIVIHGHTHKAETYTIGKTLVINPGEVCGYLTGKSTIAILDTKTMKIEIINLHE
ncbi:MAG: metallophosphoesterase [Candidatus Methanomethylicia archaeon]